MSSEMQLQEHAAPSEGWKCPACGATMPDGAVICIECGYDKRIGRRISYGPKQSWTKYTVVTTLVAVLLALSVRFYFISKAPPPRPPPVPSRTLNPPATTNAPAKTNAAPAVAATNGVAANAAPKIDTNELARIEREARTKERKEQFERQLDAKFPMFRVGEDVALRATNAVVRRGVFKGVQDKNVLLAADTNQAATVSFESLDKNTRLRCDADFRREYEEYWLSKPEPPKAK